MDPSLQWTILGFALVIAELLTGTFYLLMLGVAAFGAGAVAWLGQSFPLQATVAGIVAALGCYGVHIYRARNASRQMPNIDAGQPANFEAWIDQSSGLARVRYRGASWDARIEGDSALEPGALLYVLTADGNTLKVTARRPG